MKKFKVFTCIFLALLVCATIGVVSAEDPFSGYSITGKVFISNTTISPGTFFTGDKGTITYLISNGNVNTSVKMNHASFSDNDIILQSNNYQVTTTLGPLQVRPFTFSVLADGPDGDYYPTFSMAFFDSNLYDKTLVQIDNTPIELTIVDKPDAFSQGKKKTIYLQVANPRKNNVRNVILEVSGAGITANPSRTFIGDLASGAKIPVNVSVTPDQETTLSLLLTYYNGNNPHEVTMDIPLTFGTDKKQAYLVMSNVEVIPEGGMYRVTGDIYNAGLETANTVTVTSLSPAVPQDPYKISVARTLKADDQGSFEIAFETDGSTSIPVQLSFRDADGNVYNIVQNVTVPATSLSLPKDNGPPLVPIIAGLVIVAVFVGGWFIYLRKKKN